MRIHCPNCGYDGKQGVMNGLWTLFARLFAQTNVTCPKCGFHRAFSSADWNDARE